MLNIHNFTYQNYFSLHLTRQKKLHKIARITFKWPQNMRKWFHYKLYIRTNFSILFLFPSENFFFIRSSAVCRCESRAPKKCIVWKIEVIRQVFYVIVAQKFLLVVKGKQIFSPFEKVLWNSKAKSSERNDGCKVKVRCVM